jgi:hypothetical protein
MASSDGVESRGQMTPQDSHIDAAHSDRFVWHQDEFDEALELGDQLLYTHNTNHGEVVEISRLEHGGVRLSVQAEAAVVELTFSAEEARSLAAQLQDSEAPVDGSRPGGV